MRNLTRNEILHLYRSARTPLKGEYAPRMIGYYNIFEIVELNEEPDTYSILVKAYFHPYLPEFGTMPEITVQLQGLYHKHSKGPQSEINIQDLLNAVIKIKKTYLACYIDKGPKACDIIEWQVNMRHAEPVQSTEPLMHIEDGQDEPTFDELFEAEEADTEVLQQSEQEDDELLMNFANEDELMQLLYDNQQQHRTNSKSK